MRKIFKRVITGILSLSMLISGSLTSLAYTQSNGNGDGDYTGISTEEHVATLSYWHYNQGFRCYLVNSEGIPISNLVDFVKYYPWDIETFRVDGLVRGWEDTGGGWDRWFHRTGIFLNPGGQEYKKITYLSGAKTDAFSAYTIDGLGKINHNGGKPGGPGVKSITRTSFKRDANNPSNIHIVEGKMYTVADLQFELEQSLMSKGYKVPFTNQYVKSSYVHPDDGQSYEIYDYIPTAIDTIGGHLLLTGKYMKNLMMMPVDAEHWADNKKLLLHEFVELKMRKTNGLGIQSGGSEPLFTILDPEIKKYYEDSVKEYNKLTEEQKKSENTPMISTLMHYHIKVAFEPITWQVPVATGILPSLSQSKELNKWGYYWSGDGLLYGTPTNVAQYISNQLNKAVKQQGLVGGVPDVSDVSAWASFLEQYQMSHGWAWGYAEKAYYLEKEEYGMAPHGDVSLSLADMIRYWDTLGYGVMYFSMTKDDEPAGTPTWDKKTYPDGPTYKPGPSPENTYPDKPKGPYPQDYPSEGPDYVPVNKDHTFNIVKFYAEKQPDGTYKYKENHTRELAIHTVDINDEPGYKVDNYYTSDKFEKPTNPTDDYDVWKTNKAPKKTLEGTKAEKIQVKATDPDTTLYIRLVSTPMLTIVKYFPNGSKTVEEIPWQPTYDSSEPGYVYEQDKQSPDKPDPIPDTFESTSGTPGSNPIIPVNPSTKIVYIKYGLPPDDSKITLHQNELAHTFTMEDINTLVKLTHTFESRAGSGSDEHYCGGCISDSDGDWCPGHPCSWTRKIDDADYSYVIKNQMDYGSTTFVGSQGAFASVETGTVDDSGSLGIGGGSTNGLEPNLKFSIYRDKAKDNVTLYPNKNNSVKGELAQIYITAEGYTPQTHRVQDNGETQWNSNFKVNYVYTTEDNTLSWTSACSYDSTCHDSDSWNGAAPGLDAINSPFSSDGNVLTKAYLGQPGTGDKVTNLTEASFEMLGMVFRDNLKFTPKSGDTTKFANDGKFFEFYPYTEMEYQTVTDLTNKLAYIVSTNLSKVRNNTSMEVGVYKKSTGYGINLTSEQWSTHARTIQGLRDNEVQEALLNKSLIPGGAVVKLNTSNSSGGSDGTAETWVGFRSYEMSIPDDLKVTLSATDGVKTTSEAKAAGETFFNDMKENLNNYHVEKWIKTGITTRDNDLDHSTKVSGINNIDGGPVTSFGGNQLSTDKKYYLKQNATDSTLSKFDTIQDKFEQHVYRVYSDVHGKVVVTKDGTEIASANVKAGKDISSLLGNADVKRIDDRVKFVTNFVQSLDFEGGKDREYIPWYYEAHDGIEVVETMGAAQVGFGGSSPIRSETVDPKLTGKLENKSDILNFDSAKLDEKTRTVQYRMSASPTTKPGVAGYIGTFNGVDITVPSMNKVMRTRLHYMGNNTVMDLN